MGNVRRAAGCVATSMRALTSPEAWTLHSSQCVIDYAQGMLIALRDFCAASQASKLASSELRDMLCVARCIHRHLRSTADGALVPLTLRPSHSLVPVHF